MEGVTWRSIDAWDEAKLVRAIDKATAVIHAASVVHRPGAAEGEYDRFNAEGTRTLHAACRAAGVDRLVFLSTIKVYGEAPLAPIDEDTPTAPEGAYARTKLAAERALLDAGDGPSVLVLRLCPVFGRGDKGNVRMMIHAIARGRFLLPGDGSTRKSIVHATIVADAVLAAARSRARGVLLVADREAPTVRRLADSVARALDRWRPPAVPAPLVFAAAGSIEVIARALGRRPPVTRELLRKSMIPTVCSPARLAATLGVDCHVDLDTAIADEVAWLREQQLL
jgi:nucleoside-diphosphate-sugar epimerase